jgi:hypothetical protein
MAETAVLRNLQNGALYRHLEGDIYKNIVSGIQAKITPELAKKHLRINVEASSILNDYPQVENLINKLSLKIDINETI